MDKINSLSEHEVFEIKLKLAMITKLYDAQLITYYKYISAREHYYKQLIGK